MTDHYILPISDVRAADIGRVGGKGANLGELARAGFTVPPGFCVTTDAYDRYAAAALDEIEELLAAVGPDDLDHLHKAGQAVRDVLGALPMPADVADAVTHAASTLDKSVGLAVRSSATAEDLPTASFAGQQDTYLNVTIDQLASKVKACWVSLFTDRAILYRVQRGIGHRDVSLSVIAQEMVPAEVSGILFTADPVSGHRHIASIDAGFGLGEALVSGIITADLFRVDKRTLDIVERKVAPKPFAIRPIEGGGTSRIELPDSKQAIPSLNDRWIRRLGRIGTEIEAHFGRPQDVEWAIADDQLYIVQSRPITTLFPIPERQPDKKGLGVYVSLSHFQVMTDAMPPLAISMLRSMLPIDHPPGEIESHTVTHAGGRLYIDIAPGLRHRIGRRLLPRVLTMADERFAAAAGDLVTRPDIEKGPPLRLAPVFIKVLPLLGRALRMLWFGRTKGVAEATFDVMQNDLAAVRQRLEAPDTVAGRLGALLSEMQHAFEPVIAWVHNFMAGMLASRLVAPLVGTRADPSDVIATQRGLPGNAATEMNLAVGDLADLARSDPGVAAALRRDDLDAAERLANVTATPNGAGFIAEWDAFLERFGARGPSEIDLSRPRWTEDPSSLLQMVVNDMAQSEPGSHRHHFETLAALNREASRRLVKAAGWGRRPIVRRLLQVQGDLFSMREHHKYYIIRLLAELKRVLLEAGDDLAHRGVLESPDDVWFLTLPEVLAEYGVRDDTRRDWRQLVANRRESWAHFQTLTPPRVITSEGEIVVGRLDVDAPTGALVGTAASAGIIEGPAKVITDPSAQALEPGEILVAPFTDPGWTPLFVNARALVTEVGGLMTHGSVVAREYGIPAVVGVEHATTEIETGQVIRVNGNVGFVEVLGDQPVE